MSHPKSFHPGSSKSAKKAMKRRTLLQGLAPLPALGAAGLAWGQHDDSETNVVSGATLPIDESALADLKRPVPHGKLGDVPVSRLILGGNLIAGWAHARDLLYARRLFMEYHTREKIFATLKLCEHAGVNTMVAGSDLQPILQEYNERHQGHFQLISTVRSRHEVDQAVQGGAKAIYIIGNHCDWQVRDGRVNELARLLDYMHEQNVPAGLGAHSIQALEACDKAGLEADFFVKTLHHDRYWSAHPKENRIPFSVDAEKSPEHDHFHDNMFCLFPDRTIEFMKSQPKPWIAFKVLAAGAIPPENGFAYAFEGGADFLCVGMFDFQVIEDANTAVQAFLSAQSRPRPWHA
jgi:hypothetical protein